MQLETPPSVRTPKKPRPSPREFSRAPFLEKFLQVRKTTERLCAPLQEEDFLVSSTAETSPIKWHLAHTTWFYEQFILKKWDLKFQAFDSTYDYIFNSYYEALGAYLPKKDRHLLSRPSLERIYQYRKAIDEKLLMLLEESDERTALEIGKILEIGSNHEQQHQELMLMDIKQNYFLHPTHPVYSYAPISRVGEIKKPNPAKWNYFQGGLVEIGTDQRSFHYDNEGGKHRVFLEPFELSTKLVTNGEYLEFMHSGGYENALHWLSDGWETLKQKCWKAPLYWIKEGAQYRIMTLHGVRDLDLNEPVSHLSYYEAQAYAHFKGARLPTESEWESVAIHFPKSGLFLDDHSFHPHESDEANFSDLHGGLWEWTQSAYLPYPRYHAFSDQMGEYNSKFMCNQFVLRGGSCVTPKDHYRVTYRNFYAPDMRWQFSGLRLARDAQP